MIAIKSVVMHIKTLMNKVSNAQEVILKFLDQQKRINKTLKEAINVDLGKIKVDESRWREIANTNYLNEKFGDS